jgi:putative intracellular protease/amidase
VIDSPLAALKPPKRQRPLVAVIGINDSTETLDYLMACGILRRADVVDALLVATNRGPVKLFPVLTVDPDVTSAEFDAKYPDGADYVIVPAMSRDNDPRALDWIRAQSAKRATIIGVCAGAKVVAEAGLLDGKLATTHWYYLKELRRKHPAVEYVPNRRIVVDDGVTTTTGITASMPMALMLIEAIAGRDVAKRTARDVGLAQWDDTHDSSAFQFTREFATTVMLNTLAVWNREQFGLEVSDGIDEVSLALVADAWSRTYRSRAVTWSSSAGPKKTRNGVRVHPEKIANRWPSERLLPAIGDKKPAIALDETLEAIGGRYGPRTAHVVAMQLEYQRPR